MVGSAVCNETGLPSAKCFVYLGKKNNKQTKKAVSNSKSTEEDKKQAQNWKGERSHICH